MLRLLQLSLNSPRLVLAIGCYAVRNRKGVHGIAKSFTPLWFKGKHLLNWRLVARHLVSR
jgi:hypothetical protein